MLMEYFLRRLPKMFHQLRRRQIHRLRQQDYCLMLRHRRLLM
jgi:hypothetical protein